jgi:hypothetical protein
MAFNSNPNPVDVRLAYLAGKIKVDEQTQQKIAEINAFISKTAQEVAYMLKEGRTQPDTGRANETISLFIQASETAKQALTYPYY